MFVSTDSTSSHELVSQFVLKKIYTRKTFKTITNTASHTRLFISMASDQLLSPAEGAVTVGGTDPSNTDTATAVCVWGCVRTRSRGCVHMRVRPFVRDVFAIWAIPW